MKTVVKVPWYKKYHKHLIAGALFVVLLGGGSYYANTHKSSIVPLPTPTITATPSASFEDTNISPIPSTTVVTQEPSTGTGCDETLWKHIYNPTRLQVIERCKTISGTVAVIRHEADGDQHVLVKLDPQFSTLINAVNVSKQQGDLVIEPVCFSSPTQQDTIDQEVCNGFHQDFKLTVGEHVIVTGAYVLDAQHGWNEIHPITSVQ